MTKPTCPHSLRGLALATVACDLIAHAKIAQRWRETGVQSADHDGIDGAQSEWIQGPPRFAGRCKLA